MAQFFPRFDKTTAKLFGKISRLSGRAITDYGMVREGDKVLIGVSGGKDSLTLLNVMLHRQAIAPIDFTIAALHVDNGLPAADIPRLEKYLASLNIPLHIMIIKPFKDDEPQDLNCFWCSWTRRKAMFAYAQKNGFAKIALAHHMDDIAESILMSQLFKGEVSAMCPKQELFNGRVTIIRPLCYEREEMVIDFAKAAGLTSFEACKCPVSGDTQRAAVKKFLREMKKVTPVVTQNIFNSLRNIQKEYLP